MRRKEGAVPPLLLSLPHLTVYSRTESTGVKEEEEEEEEWRQQLTGEGLVIVAFPLVVPIMVSDSAVDRGQVLARLGVAPGD